MSLNSRRYGGRINLHDEWVMTRHGMVRTQRQRPQALVALKVSPTLKVVVNGRPLSMCS